MNRVWPPGYVKDMEVSFGHFLFAAFSCMSIQQEPPSFPVSLCSTKPKANMTW